MADKFQSTFKKIMRDISHLKSDGKMYFNCECDSNQTSFERMNSVLSLGVYAPNERQAKIMLVLLRMIYDFPKSITETLEEWYDDAHSEWIESEGVHESLDPENLFEDMTNEINTFCTMKQVKHERRKIRRRICKNKKAPEESRHLPEMKVWTGEQIYKRICQIEGVKY